LIEITDLRVQYRTGSGFLAANTVVNAVDGVSLKIARGETIGLVGESGCGKSTLGRAILRLTEPTAGRVRFDGEEITSLPPGEMRKRRRRMQVIFQDPFATLNPKMTVRQTVGEPLLVFGTPRGEIDARVAELLETVGMDRGHSDRYPVEFSGGQRQRIAIARALAAEPDLIVADEPLSALDVSIQAQVMNLPKRLQDERGLTFLFISHDLRAVRHFADRVAVMYLGRIVETGSAKEIYADPLMPYTKALISVVPALDPRKERARERIVLHGEIPSPADPPSGCPFHTRCPWAIVDCRKTVPVLQEIKPGRFTACIRISPEEPYIERTSAKK
jgi:oligopeptide transport system ATP-binding protein